MTRSFEWIYTSPLGEVLLIADDQTLEGIWFRGQKHEGKGLEGPRLLGKNEIIEQAVLWLDAYFAGSRPDPKLLPIKEKGTDFQRRVFQVLRQIPYGETRSYKEIAAAIGSSSSQAVGGAVGRNPYLILTPCHRVLDSKGRLCGYAAGLDKKKALLDLEEATYQGEKDD